MDIKALADRGKETYGRYVTLKGALRAKKAYGYYKEVNALLDEDTRSGALARLGVKVTIDICSKVLGRSLSMHPYYLFHRTHLTALSGALNAMAVRDMAREAFQRAVDLADGAQRTAGEVAAYESARKGLGFAYVPIFGSLSLLRDLANGAPAAAAQLAGVNQTREQLQQWADQALYQWRCAWAALCDDALQMLLMVEADARGVRAAVARYEEKLKRLKEGKDMLGGLGKIAAYRLEEEREYARLLNDRKAAEPQQVADAALADVDKVVKRVVAGTDAAFDPDLPSRPEIGTSVF